MTKEYKTLRVPEEAYELSKEAKRDDETWGEYLRRCSENPPTTRKFVEVGAGGVNVDPYVTMDVADELSKLREQVEQVPDRTADQLGGRFR